MRDGPAGPRQKREASSSRGALTGRALARRQSRARPLHRRGAGRPRARRGPGWLTTPPPAEPEPLPPIRPRAPSAPPMARPVRAGRRAACAPARHPRPCPARAAAGHPGARRATRRALTWPPARRGRCGPARGVVADALGVLGHAARAACSGRRPRRSGDRRALKLGGGDHRRSGQIDRLAVLDRRGPARRLQDHDARPPQAGPGRPAYVAQLALYRALLEEIYPGARAAPF